MVFEWYVNVVIVYDFSGRVSLQSAMDTFYFLIARMLDKDSEKAELFTYCIKRISIYNWPERPHISSPKTSSNQNFKAKYQ